MPVPIDPRSLASVGAPRGQMPHGCLLHQATVAGRWPATAAIAADPWDEIARQEEIVTTALAVVAAAREALTALALRSASHSRLVACDQEDWGAIIAASLDDLVGDTFGCLPEAIGRAIRELTHSDAPE